jgi:hypothetical protein
VGIDIGAFELGNNAGSAPLVASELAVADVDDVDTLPPELAFLRFVCCSNRVAARRSASATNFACACDLLSGALSLATFTRSFLAAAIYFPSLGRLLLLRQCNPLICHGWLQQHHIPLVRSQLMVLQLVQSRQLQLIQ